MVSAESWLIADGSVALEAHNEAQVKQIGSLSKIMLALLVIEEAADNPSFLSTIVVVSARAARVTGTSAGLSMGDRLTIRDLLYGLLLPSGNDAAVALAEALAITYPPAGLELLDRTIDRMNRRAKKLGMRDTQFVDVHGMAANLSTARDLLIMVDQAMTDSLFRTIVASEHHTPQVREGRGGLRNIEWDNTNKLLSEFDGVKTGYTHAAGGCLILNRTEAGRHLRVIVLGSDNQQTRFRDAYNLFQWFKNRSTITEGPSSGINQALRNSLLAVVLCNGLFSFKRPLPSILKTELTFLNVEHFGGLLDEEFVIKRDSKSVTVGGTASSPPITARFKHGSGCSVHTEIR